MSGPTKDSLPSHLRHAVNLLHQLHEAVDKSERLDANNLHDLLDDAERAVVADATLPPRRPPIDPAYTRLADVLERAFDQASGGKGKDRHVKAEGQAFDDQPICSLQRIYGNGYAFGQVGKKMEESMRMPKDAAVAELLGAINYLAAAVIVREEQDE